MFNVLMTSTMKSDPSGACARGSDGGVAVSTAATCADGRSADGIARPGPVGDVAGAAAWAISGDGETAVAAPATATPARKLRRFTWGRGSFRAMGVSLEYRLGSLSSG